jgi:hypothetical protein
MGDDLVEEVVVESVDSVLAAVAGGGAGGHGGARVLVGF